MNQLTIIGSRVVRQSKNAESFPKKIKDRLKSMWVCLKIGYPDMVTLINRECDDNPLGFLIHYLKTNPFTVQQIPFNLINIPVNSIALVCFSRFWK